MENTIKKKRINPKRNEKLGKTNRILDLVSGTKKSSQPNVLSTKSLQLKEELNLLLDNIILYQDIEKRYDSVMIMIDNSLTLVKELQELSSLYPNVQTIFIYLESTLDFYKSNFDKRSIDPDFIKAIRDVISFLEEKNTL